MGQVDQTHLRIVHLQQHCDATFVAQGRPQYQLPVKPQGQARLKQAQLHKARDGLGSKQRLDDKLDVGPADFCYGFFLASSFAHPAIQPAKPELKHPQRDGGLGN